MASEPATSPKASRALREWVQVAVVNGAAALLVLLAFSGVTWRTPWPQVFEAFVLAYFVSTCIGVPCAYLLPRLAHGFLLGRIGHRYKWIVLIAAMIGLAMAGSLAALTALWAVGYIPTSYLLRAWFGGSLKVAIIVTLLFGIFSIVVETGRTKLHAATLALRTKERDEAEARRVATEAQLASLESRVNPHFLFNTLNSIAALVRDDPAAAERMTGQLAALMRSSLYQQTPLVTLDEELRIVGAYLEIEQVRFGDRLHYRFEVAADAGDALVPRLAVQTLAENSVKYAVSPRRGRTTIVIRAVRDHGQLRLEVRDDGPGFPAAAAGVPAAGAGGHGLALLESRLALSFGERARLAVDGRPGDTSVTIELPA